MTFKTIAAVNYDCIDSTGLVVAFTRAGIHELFRSHALLAENGVPMIGVDIDDVNIVAIESSYESGISEVGIHLLVAPGKVYAVVTGEGMVMLGDITNGEFVPYTNTSMLEAIVEGEPDIDYSLYPEYVGNLVKHIVENTQ